MYALIIELFSFVTYNDKDFCNQFEWNYFITSILTANKCCNISEVSLHRYTSDIDQFPFWPKCQKCGISSSRFIIGLD